MPEAIGCIFQFRFDNYFNSTLSQQGLLHSASFSNNFDFFLTKLIKSVIIESRMIFAYLISGLYGEIDPKVHIYFC